MLVRLLERVPDLLEDLGHVAEQEQPDALDVVAELFALEQLQEMAQTRAPLRGHVPFGFDGFAPDHAGSSSSR